MVEYSDHVDNDMDLKAAGKVSLSGRNGKNSIWFL